MNWSKIIALGARSKTLFAIQTPDAGLELVLIEMDKTIKNIKELI